MVRFALFVAVAASLLAAQPLAAQDDTPMHPVTISHYKVLPGHASEYYQAIREKGVPVFDKMVEMGAWVSWRNLTAQFSDGSSDLMLLVEWPSLAATESGGAKLREALKAVFPDMSWEDWRGALEPHRTVVKNELWRAMGRGGQ